MNIRATNRWQAFSIHLLISLLIFIAILYVIVFWWFPGELFHVGGIQGVKIMAGVDLVIGPLLTLIVFNPKKKSLPVDLSIIALIQTLCLGAGMWLVHSERPLSVIYADNELYVATKNDFESYKDSDITILGIIDGPYPKYVYIELPKSKEDIETIKFISSFIEAAPLYLRTDLYRPLIENKESLIINQHLNLFSKHGRGKAKITETGKITDIQIEKP